MAGAPDAAMESGRFLLETMSDVDKLYLVPGGIGAGSNMKMVHQVLAGIQILGASEAQGFAAQLGLDAVKTAEAIKSSDSWSWMHENRLQRMLEEDWHPGASALTIILKDVVSFMLLPWVVTLADCRVNRASSQLRLVKANFPLLSARQQSRSIYQLCCRVTGPLTTLPWSDNTTQSPSRKSRPASPQMKRLKLNNWFWT